MQGGEAVPGHGIVGTLGSDVVWAGNARMAERQGAALSATQSQA
ncbi:hypothetical protein [Deinococcus radiophilus]